MARIDLKQCSLVLLDGTTPTPFQMTLKIGSGNLTWSEKKQYDFILDRGRLDKVRQGDQLPVEVSIDAQYEYVMQPAGNTLGPGSTLLYSVEDFVKKVNSGAALVTAGADACEPYAIKIRITQDQACAGVPTEIVLIPEFRYEKVTHDVRAGTIQLTGKAKVVKATVTRV